MKYGTGGVAVGSHPSGVAGVQGAAHAPLLVVGPQSILLPLGSTYESESSMNSSMYSSRLSLSAFQVFVPLMIIFSGFARTVP